MASLIGKTGRPRIKAHGTATWLELPHPAIDPGLEASRPSASYWKEMFSGEIKRVGGARHRPAFTLEYEWMESTTAASLLAVLAAEDVDFQPRGSGGPTYRCRVTSPLQDAEHLTSGYSASIQLLSIQPF
jgi:hypothetical protein